MCVCGGVGGITVSKKGDHQDNLIFTTVTSTYDTFL